MKLVSCEMFKSDGNQNLVYGCNIYGDLHVLEFKMSHTIVRGHMRSICKLLHPSVGSSRCICQ